MEIKERIGRALDWAAEDPERTARVIVLAPIIVITFAVAASHTLEVGALRAHVSGWKAWSVAGTLEILAAYSFFRFTRSRGGRRIFPFTVFLASATMILWINLASVADYSLKAIKADPFPAIFAVMPAAVFLVTAALVEVDGWKRPGKGRTSRGATGAGKPTRKAPEPQPTPENGVQGPGVDDLTLERGRRAVTALRERRERITGESLRIEMGTRKDTALAVGEALGVIVRKKKESA